MSNVENIVKTILVDCLRMKCADQIDANHSLRDDLKMDAMTSLMFLMRLEEYVDDFFVDPETLQDDDLSTVSSVVAYVHSQRVMMR